MFKVDSPLLLSRASELWASLLRKQCWHLALLKMLGTNFRHFAAEAILPVAMETRVKGQYKVILHVALETEVVVKRSNKVMVKCHGTM